jgi:hypothetical protein
MTLGQATGAARAPNGAIINGAHKTRGLTVTDVLATISWLVFSSLNTLCTVSTPPGVSYGIPTPAIS